MFSSNSSQVSAANYIEDVFSTYLYTGSGTTQTITNGIDLSTKGGMVWLKDRTSANPAWIMDTARGTTSTLQPNNANAAGAVTTAITAFGTTGFTIGTNANSNTNGNNYVSWTFRKQPKFFDIVTYTGTGANRTVAHNLGSVPGCIIVKRLNSTGNWITYHRSLGNTDFVNLNATSATSADSGAWNNTSPTSTEFSLGTGNTNVNGGTYVAYLFAHNAGGFGASDADNVISCGAFATDASGNATVNLGYEPQFMIRKSIDVGNWFTNDVMRGMPVPPTGTSPLSQVLFPNLANSETTDNSPRPTATGAVSISSSLINTTFIYIAIRRGPMKTPTSGTSVFSAKTYIGTTTSAEVTHDVTFDAEIGANRGTVVNKYLFVDSLRGINGSAIQSSSTAAEISYPSYWSRKSQRTMYAPSAFDDWWAASTTNQTHVSYGLVRAPGFFDQVCYTGDGASTKTVTHNLGVSPELIIAKKRSSIGDWGVYVASQTDGALLNTTDAFTLSNRFTSVGATSFAVRLSGTPSLNDSGATYVAYLFATCPGVSKVGSYTGNGTNQTINCGFTGGARFILIKRADSTGNWFVWDAARGIVSGNDPYLLLNSTAAEVTTLDVVDANSSGFIVNQEVNTSINVNAASYIFLAIS